ncbi:hypothetical protein B5F37_13775 [Drancourtella sp. An210]|nr:hypothetical protein B5F37_13775 [Drancourtella sp. An210]
MKSFPYVDIFTKKEMLASKKEYCMTKILTGNAVKSGKKPRNNSEKLCLHCCLATKLCFFPR